MEAEKVTRKQARKRAKTKGKAISYDIESEDYIEKDAQDGIESYIKDSIIVDVE